MIMHLTPKGVSRTVSRLIIAGAAIVALILAVSSALRVIDRHGRMSIWTVMGPSLIAAVLIVMAFAMISYLIKKFRMERQPWN
jgi:hypothetical protein